MPQLLSRRDESGWLTPSIADVMDSLPNLPFDEQFRREQAATIQRRLNDLGVNVRVVRVGAFFSHTLFVLQPGPRRRGFQGDPRAEDVARHTARLQEALGAEAVGVVPALSSTSSYIGVLVKMSRNVPLPLRSLFLTNAFQSAEPFTLLALGLDLTQQLAARDFARLPHLLVHGPIAAAQQTLQALLLNLVLFNTPAELRLAMMTLVHEQRESALDALVQMPHNLGQRLRSADESLKLLDGMLKECHRRQQVFANHHVDGFEDYNAQVRGQVDKTLPRLVIVMENLLHDDWLALRDRWQEMLAEILSLGGQVGIHILATAYRGDDRPLPGFLQDIFPTRLVLRQAADVNRLWRYDFLLPEAFVDAFLLVEEAGSPLPLTLPHTADSEVERVVAYWQHMSAQHTAEGGAVRGGPASDPSEAASGGADQAGRGLSRPTPSPEVLVRAADALTPDDIRQARAQALGAYLGWLGVGPLRDVLGMSEDEALDMLTMLHQIGVLEAGEGPVWRFIRLATPPQ